jgi:hypothetical protein
VNTKVLMVASSLALGLAGLAASFAPSELLRALGSPVAEPLPVLIQLLGSLYLAFAITNWTAKDNMIGGIYSRPLSLGNCVHFVVGSLALAKQQFSREVKEIKASSWWGWQPRTITMTLKSRSEFGDHIVFVPRGVGLGSSEVEQELKRLLARD